MINSLKIQNYYGEELTVTLSEAEPTHGLLITKIEGIGPSEAQINMTDYATVDGSIYNSSRLEKRIIDITFRFTFAKSIEDVRQLTYKYFPMKTAVTLTFYTDNRTAQITGYVQRNNPNIFSQEEGTTISIECDDPYFYEVGSDNPHITEFSSVESLFTFPFMNNSLTRNLIIFSNYVLHESQTIVYSGDAQTGILMRIHAVGPAGNITIANSITNESLYLSNDKIKSLTGSGLTAGDEVQISTVKRQRYVRLLRNGVYTNILNALDISKSDWFQLNKGDNLFSYTTDNDTDLNIVFTIENRIVYEGV